MKIPENIQMGAYSSTSITAQAAFLRANSSAYEWLVGKIQAAGLRGGYEAALHRIISAATFAAEFHSGRFADGSIENLAFDIGTELKSAAAGERNASFHVAPKDGRRWILHVASAVYRIGGHTRMLSHWVQNDRSSYHSVVIVDQRDPIPQWFSDIVRRAGGDLIVLPWRASLCQKANLLREMAREGVDLIVLHHIWFDVVPSVAFAVHDCPPVTVLNHADHVFWLGSSVSDMVINLRTAGAEHTAERRYIDHNSVIPIPLVDQMGQISRRAAREALGIRESQIVLLSVGEKRKYRPCGPYDFVATAGRILERQPGVHLYVVGESAAGIAPYLRCPMHERLHFVGMLDDPSLYRAAADVYLESFPFGSNTAMLETALCRLPIVPAYAPLFPLLVANNDAVKDILINPQTEEEYIERIEMLIYDAERREELGDALRKRVLINHVGEGWIERLGALYRETDRLTHNPRHIPSSPCCITDGDIGLSLWNVMADGKTNFKHTLEDAVGAALRHSAFVTKTVGNYPKARRLALEALWHDSYCWASWRLLAVAALGRTGPYIRRMLEHT